MVGLKKVRYEIDLGAVVAPRTETAGLRVRALGHADGDALAHLMLDAYQDTIDYEGESLSDARGEVVAWLGDSGSMLDQSLCAEVEGAIAAAVLVSRSRGLPLIGYVMTLASMKRRGIARILIAGALEGLAGAGHDRVELFITQGNVPSERLFASFGAIAVG